MNERIRTLFAVVVLTAVIWVWADLELTQEAALEVPVAVSAPPDYLVRRITPDRVFVKFKGPKGEIDELRATPDALACRITLAGADLKTGRVVARAVDGFDHWKPYRLSLMGITDENGQVTRGEVVVDLDRLVRLRVPVKPIITGYTVTGQPTVDPPEVTAVVAESALAALPEAKRYASARLAVTAAPKDLQIERDVALEPRLGGADGIEATLKPPTVHVTAQLESTLSTKTLTQIAILIAGPPEMLNTYDVVFQEDADRLIDLQVQGPRQLVEPLTGQDVRVELLLAPDDRPTGEGTWIPRVPKVFGLPVGVEVVGPLPTINFNLKKRKDEAPTP
ncbi:MAG TPA: hypothetical protein VFH53_08135 [Phycisphaerae bacterium]|nr:hypothetical protein [Phycisphaerae bacterium]